MRKLFYLLLLIPLFFAACSDDSNDKDWSVDEKKEHIVGHWISSKVQKEASSGLNVHIGYSFAKDGTVKIYAITYTPEGSHLWPSNSLIYEITENGDLELNMDPSIIDDSESVICELRMYGKDVIYINGEKFNRNTKGIDSLYN